MLKRLSFPLVILLALVSANATVWYAVHAEARTTLRVSFLDVGQGDAILVESPAGNQLLIDGGRTRGVLGKLGEALPLYDRSIDLVLETHPDADHIGGLPAVFEAYDVGAFLEPGVESENGLDDELGRIADARGAKRIVAKRGMEIDLGGGAKLAILHPGAAVADLDTNAASVVARLVYGETTFLFMGDSPQAVERMLVSGDGPKLDADVLKVGHHGSRTSTSREFAAAASPEYAVISAGRGNEYGHPHEEVVGILREEGAEVLVTAELGTIVFESDGAEVRKR